MTHPFYIALVSGVLLTSCIRFDLDSESDAPDEALRISSSEAVVLCPLAGAVEPDGLVSIVWAGYPPADDRLQLRHARISIHGELVQAPRTIAELDAELDALALDYGPEGLKLQLMQRGYRGVVEMMVDDPGAAAKLSDTPVQFAQSSEPCQVRVPTSDGVLRIFRGQAEGELPIFVSLEAPL